MFGLLLGEKKRKFTTDILFEATKLYIAKYFLSEIEASSIKKDQFEILRYNIIKFGRTKFKLSITRNFRFYVKLLFYRGDNLEDIIGEGVLFNVTPYKIDFPDDKGEVDYKDILNLYLNNYGITIYSLYPLTVGMQIGDSFVVFNPLAIAVENLHIRFITSNERFSPTKPLPAISSNLKSLIDLAFEEYSES